MDLEFSAMAPAAAAAGLDDDSVHLWRIPYARAQGRAPLVALLAAYLGVPASSVALEQDARGKPRLVPGSAAGSVAARLRFNWSHSGDFALIALARDIAPGVDIERLDQNPRALEIAERFFDPRETRALARVDAELRDRAFVGLWCAKEAVLKAFGVGLSFGLARFSFEPDADLDWRLVRADTALGHPQAWQLHGFGAAPGYRGALAWRGGARRIVSLRPADYEAG